VRRVMIGLIRFYQWAISPLMPARCIHYPTCSQYTVESIQRFGPVYGLWLAIRRLLKCHPFARGGYDPVPEKRHILSR